MNYVLHYGKPASGGYHGWERESLPIGNSYMGMSIYGNLDTEILQFNEKTLWSGGPSPSRPDYMGGNIKDSYKHLHKLRNSLIEGKSVDLKPLVKQLVGKEGGYGAYLNFGEVLIELNHEGASDYERGLCLENALGYVKYRTADGANILREHYASYPAKCMIGRVSSDRIASLALKISIQIAQEGAIYQLDSGSITASGKLEDNGLQYMAKLAINTDGAVVVEDGKLAITAASYVEYYLAAATDYANIYPTYRGEGPQSKVDSIINNVLSSNYEELKCQHNSDYKRLYSRVHFKVTSGEFAPTAHTDVLLRNYRGATTSESNKYLEELLFNYGRYLIIASSRPGTLPANLQGVWNASNSPPWSSDYHLNVNLQMNYWLTYPCGLAECSESMISYMDSLREPGRVTAKEYHNIVSTEGNPNGWVCHTQNTPFGWTCPGWDFYWGWSPASSSWMLQNVYDHYAYTGDKDILKKEIYPLILENAKFWINNLVYSKEQDRYVSAPTYSPEHGPITIGNTYEQELIWQLFDDVLSAAAALGETSADLDRMREIQAKLKPLHIGKWGQIKEWYEEDSWYKFKIFKDIAYKGNKVEKHHRHVSHMLGVFPGSHVNRKTPELLNAAKVSLLDRGFGGTGWSKAYKINLWARLKDGHNAYIMLKQLIAKSMTNNLWDSHPPFQIDGNFGLTNGICEMLVYSNVDYVELLPAIPPEWDSGSIEGIRAKGGYTVCMEWSKGQLTNCYITHPTKTSIDIYLNNATASFFGGKVNDLVAVAVTNK